MEHGVALTGGGALLRGLDQRLADETGLPIMINGNPLHAVARGAGPLPGPPRRLPQRPGRHAPVVMGGPTRPSASFRCWCATAVTLMLVGRSGGPLAAGRARCGQSPGRRSSRWKRRGTAALPAAGGGGVGIRASRGSRPAPKPALARERERARSEAARADALAAENGRLAALLDLDGPSGGEGVAARVVSTPAPADPAGRWCSTGAPEHGHPGRDAGRGRRRARRPGARGRPPAQHRAAADGRRLRRSACGVSRAGRAAPGGAGSAQGRRGSGNGRRTLRLDLLDPTAPLESGDLAVTSGLRHSRFPAGLPVGRVIRSSGRLGRRALRPIPTGWNWSRSCAGNPAS